MATLPQIPSPPPARRPRRVPQRVVSIRRARRPQLWLEVALVLLALLATGWLVRKTADHLADATAPRLVGMLLSPATASVRPHCHRHG